MDNRSIFILSGHLVGRCVFIEDAGLLLTNSSGLSLNRGPPRHNQVGPPSTKTETRARAPHQTL